MAKIVDWTVTGISAALLAIGCWVSLFRVVFLPSYVPSCMRNCTISDLNVALAITVGGIVLTVGVTGAGMLFAAIKKRLAVIWPLLGILLLVCTNLLVLAVVG